MLYRKNSVAEVINFGSFMVKIFSIGSVKQKYNGIDGRNSKGNKKSKS